MKKEKNKIYFLPYHPHKGHRKHTNEQPFAVVDTKYGYMSINAWSIRQLGMEKKFIKLYYEPDRNIIGWKTVSRLENDFRLWKLVKLTKTNQFRVYIGGILPQFKNLHRSYRANIHQYVEKTYLENNSFYFIRLSKENKYDPARRNSTVPGNQPIGKGTSASK